VLIASFLSTVTLIIIKSIKERTKLLLYRVVLARGGWNLFWCRKIRCSSIHGGGSR